MKTAEKLIKQIDDPTLTYDERAMLCCQIAAELEHRGKYDEAQKILTPWWRGIGQRPLLHGLKEPTATEILLRVGTLSGWLGSVRQIEGAQEAAKDLISESITRFQTIGETTRAVTARSELGFCYWRAGAFDEARIIYNDALKELQDEAPELKAKISIRLTMVEFSTGRFNDAFRILTDISHLLSESENHALKGKYYNQLCCVLMFLSKTEHRPDYLDRAILECTAAVYHFEQAGHTSYRASAESNLGFLFYTIGRYENAHKHLAKARTLFKNLNDSGRLAQVDDVRARVLLAEGKVREAAHVITEAVQTLSQGGEQALLAEALTTQGQVLARLGDVVASQVKLREAANVAEQAGALEDAGKALLVLLEEHGGRLGEEELAEIYERADGLLRGTQDAETMARLRACARRVVAGRRARAWAAIKRRSRVDFWANFSLQARVEAYEARYIKRALIEARGSVSRAARLLGMRHHASLAMLLKGRHKGLAYLRTPAESRRQNPARMRGRRAGSLHVGQAARAIRIMHAEDDKLVADATRQALALEGWQVESVSAGVTALRRLTGETRYDLLLLDNELPGVSGVELARAARRLEHRRQTPIIMLSAADVKAAAERAGVDVFLRKPDDISKLVETIARLLGSSRAPRT